MDLAQKAASFGELQVEHGIGGLEDAFVVSEYVFNQVLGLHHAFPAVLHVLLHHFYLQLD